MLNLFDLKSKVAIISGASSGLGADAAKAFAESGANIAVLARRKEKLDALKESLTYTGVEILPIACDVTNEENVKNAVDEVFNKFGRIDILINNAGVAIKGTVDVMETSEWNRAIQTNLNSIYNTCKYVLPHMKDQNYGKVVNIASVNAVISDKNPPFLRHSYNATKAAVVGLTRAIAASHAQFGITCNAVGPGLFESEMTEGTLFKSEEFLKKYNFVNPTSRPAKRGELNGTLIYLSTDASSYVNGQLILVDGGATLV